MSSPVPCDEFEEVCVELIQEPDLEYPPVSYNWTINGIDYEVSSV